MCFGPFKKFATGDRLLLSTIYLVRIIVNIVVAVAAFGITYYSFTSSIAPAIIKVITLMTIHCSRQMSVGEESTYNVGFITFIFFSGMTLYHFINSIYEGPGYLPYNWAPKCIKDCQLLQFCNVCQGYKAPRSHHCRKCSRCVLKMDHHCPWINNCVGHCNHGYFTAFLASSVVGCCVSTYILVSWLMAVFSTRPLPFNPPSIFILVSALFSIGLSVGVVIAVGMLLYFQLQSIVRNQTGIEQWIIEKANYRRSITADQFTHPYSKGWLFNTKQVLSWHCVAPGDGTTWPVIEGCDQYTLTREQLAQKQEKRKRAKRYRVIAKATGSWIPISYGFKVLCSPPITDEPRIKLDVGNTVMVTRWRNHWLFGEKEGVTIASNGKDNRVRGWFPRPCAIPVSGKDGPLDDYFDLDLDTQNFIPNTKVTSKSTETDFNHRMEYLSSKASKKKHK